MIEDWDPIPVDEVAAILEAAPFRWWICGGLSLEMYAGQQWRDHEDLDIGLVRSQGPDVHAFLSPQWDLWVAAGGTLRPWSGSPLDAGCNENNVWVREGPGSPWRLDLTVGSGSDEEWIYRRNEAVRRPWEEAISLTDDGIPYLAPEIQLLFKSKDPKPKDDLDAETVFPMLEEGGRAFLDETLDAGHAWRAWMN